MTARRPSGDRERGSMHVMTIPVAVGMLTAAVLVISMVGTATDDRREAGTAADAAALAATQEWDEHLGLLHALHLGVDEPEAFWDLAEEALLTPELEGDMRAVARAYAEENGAELLRLDIDTARLRVTAEVRHEVAVPGTGIRSEAAATAGVRLRGGLCLADGGPGWVIDGECRTSPEPEPGGEGSENGSGGEGSGGEGSGGEEEEPAWSPPEVEDYTSSVVLVG
ncbi:pilus assembly protein TadG-related protein [Promicromonospora sp. NPDC052451]|uniref:pilus assembly protein TadG-related protein n=1 Tax=Promicromonospora sp. NPDC052451 TaxID=3364407 RepID=UPI0037CC0A6F